MANFSLRRLFLILLLFPIFLFSRGKVIYKEVYENVLPPWLTGPLLAPSTNVVPLGHYNIEPYLYATAYNGSYNGEWERVKAPVYWNTSLQVPIQIGLASWLDIQISPTLNYNYTEHQAAWALGDLPVILDIQLFAGSQLSWVPSVKLALRENVPIGKYRNLNPKKLTTDDGGIGSWVTGLAVVLGHLHHIRGVYYFNYRVALNYNLPAPVRLKGFNFYGGGYGTDIRFFPPQYFQADLGIEITLAQTWAFALDVLGLWYGKSHHSGGTPGVDESGKPAVIHKRFRRSQAQYSLAPAIEYNWNANFGLIAGAWFSFAGRHALAFTSGVIAFNYYK